MASGDLIRLALLVINTFLVASSELSTISHMFGVEKTALLFRESEKKSFFRPIRFKSKFLETNRGTIESALIPVCGINGKACDVMYTGQYSRQKIIRNVDNAGNVTYNTITIWHSYSSILPNFEYTENDSGMKRYAGNVFHAPFVQKLFNHHNLRNDPNLKPFGQEMVTNCEGLTVDCYRKTSAELEAEAVECIDRLERDRASQDLRYNTLSGDVRITSIKFKTADVRLSHYMLPAYILKREAHDVSSALYLSAVQSTNTPKGVGPKEISTVKVSALTLACVLTLCGLYEVSRDSQIALVCIATILVAVSCVKKVPLRMSSIQSEINAQRLVGESVGRTEDGIMRRHVTTVLDTRAP